LSAHQALLCRFTPLAEQGDAWFMGKRLLPAAQDVA
jgi:hypothetical protein